VSAPLSVVIPTLNAAPALGPTLASLAEGLTEGLIRELILSDGGSSDGIERIADDVGATLIVGPPSRGGQLRRGAEAARGDWLLLLHADTVLAPGWTLPVRRHMETEPQAAGHFRLRFDARGPGAALTAGWANLRSRAFGLPCGDQGLLIARRVLAAAGGVPDQPLMEDVALVRRLTLRPLDAVAVTSAARYREQGWLRRGARNLTTLALWHLGASPERLARRYTRR
jgi:rSAM/selenodomain-associated transferase 2